MSDIIQTLVVDGIPSYWSYDDIRRGFFQLKEDHEMEFVDDETGMTIPCEICQEDVRIWGSAFRSRDCDEHESRDITIRF